MTRRRALVIAGVVVVAAVIGLLTVGQPLTQSLFEPPSCGSDRLDPTTGKVASPEVRQCILSAYQRHAAARSEHILPTAQGDPIIFAIRLSGRDDFELSIDTTHDRAGPRGVTHYRCAGLTSNGSSSSLTLSGCEPGGSTIQIQ